jgi:plastocyanin
MTPQEISLLVARRLRLPQSERPRIQTFIDEGLNTLAYQTANDRVKRKWLLTDKSTATATVTQSGKDYYADLSTLITTPGIMVDYLEYGKVFHTVAALVVSSASWTVATDIISAAHNFTTGTKVQLSTSGSLPTGLSLGTDYYVIRLSPTTFALASSKSNAFAGTKVGFSSQGSGSHTVTQWEDRALSFDTPVDCSLPTATPSGQLLDKKLYLNNVYGGSLAFTVPFIPTLSTLPQPLETDLVDAVVAIAARSIPRAVPQVVPQQEQQ